MADPVALRFSVFVLVSLVAFLAILQFTTRKRARRPRVETQMVVAALVVVGGMTFAKFGHNLGLPWWIYYTVPALATLLVPPLVFRFSRRELVVYLVLAFLSSPVIHALFSFVLGWHEYMPFLPVPYWRDAIG